MKRRSPETIASEFARTTQDFYDGNKTKVSLRGDVLGAPVAVVTYHDPDTSRAACDAIRRTIAAAIRADRKQRKGARNHGH